MIFVDASAMVAIMAREAEADDLRERLEAAERRLTSSIAIYEAVLAIARKRSFAISDSERFVSTFLIEAEIDCVTLGEGETRLALDAFERFGKGRHPAALNMGDCFAYACARAQGASLLFKGDDFSKTDIEAA